MPCVLTVCQLVLVLFRGVRRVRVCGHVAEAVRGGGGGGVGGASSLASQQQVPASDLRTEEKHWRKHFHRTH